MRLSIAVLLAGAAAQTWVPVPLTDPAALCLDGSPGAYQVKPGAGENATKFVLFFQGGGWAMSPADLRYRAGTALGSTRGDAPNDEQLPARAPEPPRGRAARVRGHCVAVTTYIFF